MADDSTHDELLQSIIDQKPLETKTHFDSLVKDRIADMLDVYKDHIAASSFGGEKEEEPEEETPEGEEPEADDKELSDEEIDELIGGLSDEELEELIADLDTEEEKDQGEVEPPDKDQEPEPEEEA